MPTTFTLESKISAHADFGGDRTADYSIDVDEIGPFLRINGSFAVPRTIMHLSIPLEMLRDLIAAYDATTRDERAGQRFADAVLNGKRQEDE